MDVPGYLFTGFLESGKSSMMKETLSDPEFNDGSKTLILACEQGEVEFDQKFLKETHSVLVTVEDKEELTADYLEKLEQEYRPKQVFIEFNGMWSVTEFLDMEFPINWMLVQIISTVDAQTFMMYVNNMRSLMYDQLVHSEMILINRCDSNTKKSFLRSNIKAINKGAQIIYESVDGGINDLPEDDLPFDLNAAVIDIQDDDYGLWYMDALDHPYKYDGKVVRFKGKVVHVENDKRSFVMGRYAMVCCAEDTSLIGYLCKCAKPVQLVLNEWIVITARIEVEYDEEYQRNLVVPHVQSLQPTEELKDDLVYFS